MKPMNWNVRKLLWRDSDGRGNLDKRIMLFSCHFWTKKTEQCPDDSQKMKYRISLEDIYNEFKEWFRDNNPGKRCTTRVDFIKGIS